MESFDLELLIGQLSTLATTSMMFDDVKEKQDRDPELQGIRNGMQEDKYPGFRLDDHGILFFGSRSYVPDDSELRRQILIEAHRTPYALHLGSTKTYQDLKQNFWWNGMKKNAAKFV